MVASEEEAHLPEVVPSEAVSEEKADWPELVVPEDDAGRSEVVWSLEEVSHPEVVVSEEGAGAALSCESSGG